MDECIVCNDCSKYAYDEDYFNVIMKYNFYLLYEIERVKPECVRVLSPQYAIGYKKMDESISFSSLGYNSVPKCYGLMENSSIVATNVDAVRKATGLGLTGKDVILGIIDTGIDYENKLFRKMDGSTRILAMWDQTVDKHEEDKVEDKADTGEVAEQTTGQTTNQTSNQTAYTYISGYGTVYTEDEINIALNSSTPKDLVNEVDDIGHGTFLASIAAGGHDPLNDFYGVAPECDLAIVKLKQAKNNIRDFYGIAHDVNCYQEDDIISGIRFLLSVAEEKGKSMCILMGVGTNQGGHDGNSYLEQYIDAVGVFNRIVFVNAAGNELTYGGHSSSRSNENKGKLESNGRYEIELNVGKKLSAFSMEIWAKSPGLIRASVKSPTGQEVELTSTGFVGNETSHILRRKFVYENTTLQAEIINIEETSGDQIIFLKFTLPFEGIWSIIVWDVNEEVNTEWDMWLPINQFINEETRFLTPDVETIICSPANGDISLTAAGYNHRNNAMYTFSSRGYTRGLVKKPDVCAPAVDVTGAFKSGLYIRRSGTSVAAAHLAGAVILLLEWGTVKGNLIDINSRIIKQLIIRGARRLKEENYPNRVSGWGILDIDGIFTELR